MQKSVAFYTLGCKLNFAETSTIGRQLQEHGMQKKEFTEGADIYVINTCSVTENADRKCKKVVKEAKRYNPDAFVVVIGCYAQLKPQEIVNITGVNLVLGAAEKFNLVHHLSGLNTLDKPKVFNASIKETNIFIPGFSAGDRTRSFLKVQDGCDYFCSFCTIPLARGKSRSGSIKETIEVAQNVAQTGVKEVVLTGVNIGDFGVGSDESFYQLIQQLDKVEGIARFRISSIEPNLLTDDIIRFVAASEKFVPHFHIPLQSGSNEMLLSMRRKYRRELYADRVALIKQVMPDACIGVDVIVGFPGETDEAFEETFAFVRDLDVSYLHVFPYSERANTTARKLPDKVNQQVKNERVQRLRILSEKKRMAFYREHLGKTFNVIFEAEQHGNMMNGFTENYIKVETPYDPLMVNEIVPFLLADINAEGTVNGELVHQNQFLLH